MFFGQVIKATQLFHPYQLIQYSVHNVQAEMQYYGC